jgi:hypothetical protein
MDLISSFKVKNVTNYTTGEWMPRQDSHLQSPDSESGDLLIRLLGIGWDERNRTSNFLVNSQALCQLSYTPMSTQKMSASPPDPI